jgi:hypothetical protein
METEAAAGQNRGLQPPAPAESIASRRLGAAALWAGLLVRVGTGVLALSAFLPLWLAAFMACGLVSLIGIAQLLDR